MHASIEKAGFKCRHCDVKRKAGGFPCYCLEWMQSGNNMLPAPARYDWGGMPVIDEKEQLGLELIEMLQERAEGREPEIWSKFERVFAVFQCAACGQVSNISQGLCHHVSYFPEVTVTVHYGCHIRIHRSKAYLSLRPPDGDAARFYSMPERVKEHGPDSFHPNPDSPCPLCFERALRGS